MYYKMFIAANKKNRVAWKIHTTPTKILDCLLAYAKKFLFSSI